LRIEGPLLQCQLLESTLLNILNFQTLIATKTSRVYKAAAGDPVIEFGMRRAQGPDGALSASRAAYIGGCVATSHTLAGQLFGIPVRGTHSHSWVTAFPSEQEAFEAYASVMPDRAVFLVDTYDTIKGVQHAIQVGKRLRAEGADLLGIRLDSGDLAALSIKARQLLDEAGFQNTYILASNSLDEYVIRSLKEQDAAISAWGVGTHLSTAYDQPALDGVYKLSALQNINHEWEYKLKLSESPIKISNPGRHQVRRFFSEEKWSGDVIYDIALGIDDNAIAIQLMSTPEIKYYADIDGYTDLLQPIFKAGSLVYQAESIHSTRQRAIDEISYFWRTYKEAENYPVGLENKLYQLKEKLIIMRSSS
jgi:nicotinate phosphoribosyltransferase